MGWYNYNFFRYDLNHIWLLLAFLPSWTIMAIALRPSPLSSIWGFCSHLLACSSLPATVWAVWAVPALSAATIAEEIMLRISFNLSLIPRAKASACGVLPTKQINRSFTGCFFDHNNFWVKENCGFFLQWINYLLFLHYLYYFSKFIYKGKLTTNPLLLLRGFGKMNFRTTHADCKHRPLKNLLSHIKVTAMKCNRKSIFRWKWK